MVYHLHHLILHGKSYITKVKENNFRNYRIGRVLMTTKIHWYIVLESIAISL